MSRVRAFFVEEAEECLEAIDAELSGRPDPGAVYRSIRLLRGSAQVARFGALANEAGSLEAAVRPTARGERPWDEALERRVRQAAASLAERVDAVREGRTEQDEDEREPMAEQGHENGAEAVPVETLEYRGDAALQRALELREPLEKAVSDGDPDAVLDELFDLIRLGTK